MAEGSFTSKIEANALYAEAFVLLARAQQLLDGTTERLEARFSALLAEIDSRFVSLNSVPVERTSIRASEWATIRQYLNATRESAHETSARLPTAFGSMHRNLQSLCDRLNEVFDVTEEGDVPDELCREAREAIEELWQERDQSLTFQAKAEIWRDGYRKGLAEASPSQPTPCWCPYCREPHGVNRQTEDPWKRAQEKSAPPVPCRGCGEHHGPPECGQKA